MWKPQGMYANYILNQPTIFFGVDSINGLVSMPGAKISVIHGSSLSELTKNTIKNAFKKKTVFLNERSWNGEPDLESLSDTIRVLEIQQPDVIIGVGGGSVIDGAKLCRLFYECPGFQNGKTRINQINFSSRFIAIPTTVGSGSEVSSAAVYINKDEHKKQMIVCHNLQPEAVVFDSNLVQKSPLRLTIASGIDAMAHIIEGYVSNIENELANIMAEIGLKILMEELIKNDNSTVNYSRLQYAGYLGGIVQNHCIVGAAHGIAHQLTEDGFSHGEAVALILPAVIRENSKEFAVQRKYEQLFKKIGISSVELFLEDLKKILSLSGIFNDYDKLKNILKEKIKNDSFVKSVANDQGAKGNPITIDQIYLENLVGGL